MSNFASCGIHAEEVTQIRRWRGRSTSPLRTLTDTAPDNLSVEAQKVIPTDLEERLAKLATSQSSAYSRPEALQAELVNIQHLLEISRGKCEVQTRQTIDIKQHVGTRYVSINLQRHSVLTWVRFFE